MINWPRSTPAGTTEKLNKFHWFDPLGSGRPISKNRRVYYNNSPLRMLTDQPTVKKFAIVPKIQVLQYPHFFFFLRR